MGFFTFWLSEYLANIIVPCILLCLKLAECVNVCCVVFVSLHFFTSVSLHVFTSVSLHMFSFVSLHSSVSFVMNAMTFADIKSHHGMLNILQSTRTNHCIVYNLYIVSCLEIGTPPFRPSLTRQI